jgi:hypothetical protein
MSSKLTWRISFSLFSRANAMLARIALLSSDFRSCSFLLPALAPLAISSTFTGTGTEESLSTGIVEGEPDVEAA